MHSHHQQCQLLARGALPATIARLELIAETAQAAAAEAMLEAQDAAARVQFAEEVAQEASAATTICEMNENLGSAVISPIHVNP